MHAPDCPLTGVFEFTAGTFTAGEFESDTSFAIRFFEDEASVPGIDPGTIRSYWAIAAHD